LSGGEFLFFKGSINHMKKNNQVIIKTDRETAFYYLKTFANLAREPFLILAPDLKVVGANTSFYETFHVTKEQTEGQLVYNLGNGQWNIPELRELLENILPDKKFFNDFEVTHNFPEIGLKIMLLNAMQLDATQQILLAIEDVTLRKTIEKRLVDYSKNLEKGVAEKTIELRARVDELSKLNKLMVGRELKMMELKEEIALLKNKK